tara:strand:- start:110 stop:631 length:522 start_codon:yes stop_codon:yes gene_type:complete
VKRFFVILFFLVSCSGDMNLNKYSNKEPLFTLEDYFLGKTEAWGLFHDRFGNLKRSFKVNIQGTLSGDELTLDEKFLYDDGEEEQRIWKIKILGNNKYSGTAEDVVGEALGESKGNALNWKYKLNLKVNDSTIKVDFDDWMFLQDRNILMNRAEVKKWGINIGVVTITFLKID